MAKLGFKVAVLFLSAIVIAVVAGCGGVAGSGSSNAPQTATGVSDAETIRTDRAVEFAYAVFTNTQIVDNQLQGVKTRDADVKRYIDPDAELYEWSPTSHDNLSILMHGGLPDIARDVEVTGFKGDVCYLTVSVDTIESLDPVKTSSRKSDIVVIFNDDNLIEHAYYREQYESGKLTN